ncbi:sensor histidine kinase [Opitutus terrae]|nr:HAMP domain-containing sensor histidine kinase [Opitutus terrae]
MASLLPTSVLCIGADAAGADLLAVTTRRLADGVAVRSYARLADVPPDAAVDGAGLLALCDPDAATLREALAAKDHAALPRWAVLVLGAMPDTETDGTLAVAREEWAPAVLAHAMRGALALHRCRREHAQLCGDVATFGSRIAHDLRTPLGGVMTTTEMLHEILMESDPDNAALTQPILDSADGLVKLIERMSFLAKAIASREPPQRVDMGVPFWNAFQQLESRLLATHTPLTYPQEWPAVHGHSTWLQVVWRELIANAVQHGSPGAPIEAGWNPVAGGFRFWVQDHGRVAPSLRPVLFMPFHRLNEPGAPRGLGLAIVQRLIAAEGGTCSYEPTRDGESCFTFTLPAASPSDSVSSSTTTLG